MRDRSGTGRRTRSLASVATALGLLGASVYLTVELKEEKASPVALPAVAAGDGAAKQQASSADGEFVYERLSNPARTVARAEDGSVAATFTDGARTAVLAGPVRTFTEEEFTTAKVTTDRWVRLLPETWKKGAEQAEWFTTWFEEHRGSKKPDLLALSVEYLHGAEKKADERGIAYTGDADFGPLNPDVAAREADLRLEQSDFYDYLGMSYTFRDGTVLQPERMRHRDVDCSGYVRLVFGYRARYPLAPTDELGDGLPRTADAMARSDLGVPVLELTGERPSSLGRLQPGDLVFFEVDARTGPRLDHIGIYMGLDTDGHPRFISSRAEANGPTFGDKGGDARLDGDGYYAEGLRSARRL
jgi:cell wall-associated NlpC family hydrolase